MYNSIYDSWLSSDVGCSEFDIDDILNNSLKLLKETNKRKRRRS